MDARQIVQHADRFKHPVVGCFGATYKPDVEDLRESPPLEVIKLVAANSDIRVVVCDPMIKRLPDELSGMNKVSLASLD